MMRSRREPVPAASRGEIAELVRGVADGLVTRRQLLVRAAALGVSLSTVGTLLAACGSGGGDAAAGPAPLDTTLPAELKVLNWTDYIAPQTLKQFEAKHGVKVDVTFCDANEKTVSRLEEGEVYDIVWPTDSWVSVLSKAGLLQPLHMDLIPNFANVTQPLFQNPPFDPGTDGTKYSVPYMFGTVGFCVRLDEVANPGESWSILFDPSYKGEISMLDGSRETIGAALMKLGYTINSTDQGQLDEATALLIEQKKLITGYESASPSGAIIGGTALTMCWDGDAITAINKIGMSKVNYVLPTEGYQVWADGVCVPKNAPSPYAAHLFLDFLLDPRVAAANSNFLGYQPVVEAADPMIESLVQRAMRPTPEVLAQGQLPKDLGEFNDAYDAAWKRIQSA
jgi:spermidine/putrescine transport system substrate-binding protein